MNFKIFYLVLVSFLISLSSIADDHEIDNNNTKYGQRGTANQTPTTESVVFL